MALPTALPAVLVLVFTLAVGARFYENGGAAGTPAGSASSDAAREQRAEHILYNSGLWLFALGVAVSTRRRRAPEAEAIRLRREGQVAGCTGLQ